MENAEPLPEMVDLIKCLKAEGILVALLTNNWLLDKDNTFMPLDRSLFDQVQTKLLVLRVNYRKVLTLLKGAYDMKVCPVGI